MEPISNVARLWRVFSKFSEKDQDRILSNHPKYDKIPFGSFYRRHLFFQMIYNPLISNKVKELVDRIAREEYGQ